MLFALIECGELILAKQRRSRHEVCTEVFVMSSAMGISHSPRPVSRVWGGPRAPQAKAIKATTVGLILLDSSLKLLYSNSEALRISAYPRQPRTALGAEFMKSIRVILGKKASVDDFPMVTHFTSGKRRYLCRTFVLEAAPVRDSKPAFLICAC